MKSIHDLIGIRELQESDISLIIAYWLHASPAYLEAMGVDLSKLPSEADWNTMLQSQLQQEYSQKQSYCLIWLLEGRPIGHCNVNKISFGEEASMHLHIWYEAERKQSLGVSFVRLSLPVFFAQLQLQRIISEPYAYNIAPNKALARAGFTKTDQYVTVPGSINTEQLVNRWMLSLEAFRETVQY